MTKLTKDMKTATVQALLDHKFKPLTVALAADAATLAEKLHADFFGDDLEKMKRVPKGWLPTSDRSAYFTYDNKGVTLFFSGHVSYRAREYTNERTIFDRYFDKRDKRLLHTTTRHTVEMSVKYTGVSELCKRVFALQDQYIEAEKELHRTLYPFTQVEKLLEHWPEVQPFVPEYVPPVKNLPAVQADALNAKFELPVS